MAVLERDLRRRLERTIKEARIRAEAAVRESVERLGVVATTAPGHLTETTKALRVALRAHARRLGDRVPRGDEGVAPIRLIEAAAYVRWHRLLFARFLAERRLLRHPEQPDIALSLSDCAELAREEGLTDGYAVAARYAARWLPAVFDESDPACRLELAPEYEGALRVLVEDLPPAVFTASDSLGWTYQYWRAAEKDAVNASGVKIGRDELPAVTQLFTEPYMVQFLLHNTLGAWWAGKQLAANPALADLPNEAAVRAAVALPGVEWTYLRFLREEAGEEQGRWRPAAGVFPGWPREAASLTVLDPCCGSGHFLTEAVSILVALRVAEDAAIGAAEATTAVLRDNLFGLEIDGRCVQIAAFAVALAAWETGGWQTLPNPHIAWAGSPPPLPRSEFEALGNGDPQLRQALGALHDLFRQAPLLGSLIEVKGGDLVARADLAGVEEAMERLASRSAAEEPDRAEGAIAARGMADAAALLARRWVFQVTNVPYLGRGKQIADLKAHLERHFNEAKSDLATAMLVRMLRGSAPGGSVAAVTPQTWLFLTTYRQLRETLLDRTSLVSIVDLGPAAFQEMNWWAARTTLITVTNSAGRINQDHFVIDADTGRNLDAKPDTLITESALIIRQEDQRSNPDHIISVQRTKRGALLELHVDVYEGMSTGDNDRYRLCHWEVQGNRPEWSRLISTNLSSSDYGGRHLILRWENGEGNLVNEPGARIQGLGAWKQLGFSVSVTGQLRVQMKDAVQHEKTTVAVIPRNQADATAIYAFLRSSEYSNAVRSLNKKTGVSTGVLCKVPFDLAQWRQAAAERYPDGLPEPWSDDPTQWLFHGHPAKADTGAALHVALARLAGYRWPAESDATMRLSAEARQWIARAGELPTGDKDGILALGAVHGERPLADRLRAYLAAAFGAEWSHDMEERLVSSADAKFERVRVRDHSLEAWLRDRAFRQHCKLFHDRPFLWQLWDGRADGFSAFVHYHRLDRRALERLTYTVIGDAIARADGDGDTGRAEAARVLQAKLRLILDGEAPHDIFVRWKALEQLPLGWSPDLEDGVRMNIRPFVQAGVLRDMPNIHWRKDRGKDVTSAPWYPVHRGERINDHHTTLAEKRGAREAATQRLAMAGDTRAAE